MKTEDEEFSKFIDGDIEAVAAEKIREAFNLLREVYMRGENLDLHERIGRFLGIAE